MAIHLGTSVSVLSGIGAKASHGFKKLGIRSVRDLLFHFPYRYDDFSVSKPISDLRHGNTVTITGEIKSISSRRSSNKRVMLTEAILENETGELPIMWFNQPYLEKSLHIGTKLSVAGTIDRRFGKTNMVSPVHEPAGKNVHTGRIVPIYSLTGDIAMRRVRNAIEQVRDVISELTDWLPEEIRLVENLTGWQEAVTALHFPENKKQLETGINRLKFNELLLHQLMFAEIRKDRKAKRAIPIEARIDDLKAFVKDLPFTLTNAQRRAAWEIVQDMEKDTPTNRLLQGDVGSGKTVVAALASLAPLREGKQVAYLAPTEILATQQHETFMNLIKDQKIGLFTRSFQKIQNEDVSKDEIISQLADGSLKCVIGTHALIQDIVDIPELAFVTIDEQHRFGVQQRHRLLERKSGPVPHLLSMTATPIPRSLSLTLYGDLDISIIDELPAGRKPIITTFVEPGKEGPMYTKMREEIEQGRQVYVICPLIDPSDKLGSQSVKEVAAYLGKGPLKGSSIGILHGQLKGDEKAKVLQSFSKGKIDILVSTTVVEVGVDIPNATVMVIKGAERFGLAQLHQLRGRVGRSDIESYCFLNPDQLGGLVQGRLQAVVSSQNGFVLAEKDLELRGAGNVFGSSQSGFPEFRFATMSDIPIMKKAHKWAVQIFEEEGIDNYPLLEDRLDQAFDEVHFE